VLISSQLRPTFRSPKSGSELTALATAQFPRDTSAWVTTCRVPIVSADTPSLGNPTSERVWPGAGARSHILLVHHLLVGPTPTYLDIIGREMAYVMGLKINYWTLGINLLYF
jgi:hypothetical protein